MDIAEKIAAEIDAIPGQPTAYEVARVAIEAYQREMWTPHFDLSRKFNLLPELRRNRASQLTAHIMSLIGKYICEHDEEHDFHRRASGDLFEAIYESGCDVITDADRKAAQGRIHHRYINLERSEVANARTLIKALGAEIERLTAENERLHGLIKAGSEQVEKIAFFIPPPNSYTPQLVLLAQALRREAINQQLTRDPK